MFIDIAILLVGLGSPQTFACTVTRVHDGDGPLWYAEGPKVRIASVQAPDFESATPEPGARIMRATIALPGPASGSYARWSCTSVSRAT